MIKRVSIAITIVILATMLSACGNHVWHYVRKGDTLYSVSFRYGQDYNNVAAWNHIEPPFVISPGQRLRVSPPTSAQYAGDRTQKRVADNRAKPAAGLVTVTQSPVTTPTPTLNKGGQTSPARPPQKKQKTTAIDPAYPKIVTWSWPTTGKIIESYSTKQLGPKGIDIAGPKGRMVKAAASGKVVYAGEGLVSYGRLIIIKHNEQYLSAYAHNHKILVKEGQQVSAGSVIAEMGDSGTDKVMLHFEIRKRGKPVNPLHYLPKH